MDVPTSYEVRKYFVLKWMRLVSSGIGPYPCLILMLSIGPEYSSSRQVPKPAPNVSTAHPLAPFST